MKTISEQDIKRKLAKHYDRKDNGYSFENRELHKVINKDSYSKVGSIFYSLDGSPPKGYAIVIPEIRTVNLYNGHGKRFKIFDETVIEELKEYY